MTGLTELYRTYLRTLGHNYYLIQTKQNSNRSIRSGAMMPQKTNRLNLILTILTIY